MDGDLLGIRVDLNSAVEQNRSKNIFCFLKYQAVENLS